MSKMEFIKAEDITFSWGSTEILHKVSMSAGNGAFVGVIGPNGSGKSTFLKCVYRIWEQNGGVIWIDGKETSKMSYRDTARLLGVVAQHNVYDFDFSVKEVVLMGRSPHKKLMERDNAKDLEIVRNALREVGMEEFEKRPFAGLSGGEQQRVILARALAQETKGFILDEPTNHLDIKYQLQLLSTVKRMHKTVMAAFHDLNIAALYCDEIYVMKKGNVYATGTPREILTEELIRDVYEVEAQIIEDKNGNPHIIYCP